MTAQMGKLDYMELLGELDTDEVEPMAHALDVSDVFRADGSGRASTAPRLAKHPTPTASVTGCRPCWARNRKGDLARLGPWRAMIALHLFSSHVTD